jgi:hypothetical protein
VTDERRLVDMPTTSAASQPYIPLQDWQDDSYETTITDAPEPRHNSKHHTEIGNVILDRSRTRFFTVLLIHGPAIILSSLVIYLAGYPRFWLENEWNSNAGKHMMSATTLSRVFQFVAKAHEILVVVSLSSMVLNVVKFQLVDGSEGVALGMLTAPYRVGDIRFLFSGAFWTSASSRLAWTLTALFALCTLLSLLIGPASAIGFVPTQNWWVMPNPFGTWLVPVHWADKNFTGPISIEHLWPTQLNGSLVKEKCATITNPTDALGCPSEGVQDILSRLMITSLYGAPMNTSISAIKGGVRRQLVSQSYACGSTRCSIATTLSHTSLLGFGMFWDYVKSNDGGEASEAGRPRIKSSRSSVMMQPLVQVACTSLDYFEARTGTSNAEHPYLVSSALGWFDEKDSSRSINVTVPSYLWNLSQPVKESTFQWIDTANLSFVDYRRPTIASIATVPYTLAPGESSNGSSLQSSFVVSCAIDARWMYSQTIYDPAFNDLIYSNVSIPENYEVNPGVRSNLEGIGPRINISSDWMKYVDVREAPTNTSYTEYLLEGLRDTWPNTTDLRNGDSRGEIVSSKISNIISMLLVDGIARTHYGKFVPLISLRRHDENTSQIDTQSVDSPRFLWLENTHTIDESALNRLVPMELIVERFGWGTGAPGSATIFALAMMAIYLSLVAGYMCYASFSHIVRRPYSVNSWGTLEELIVLALKSMPPLRKLDEAGAAIRWKSPLWKEKVKVKGNAHRSVEMLMEDREGMCTLSANVEYH